MDLLVAVCMLLEQPCGWVRHMIKIQRHYSLPMAGEAYKYLMLNFTALHRDIFFKNLISQVVNVKTIFAQPFDFSNHMTSPQCADLGRVPGASPHGCASVQWSDGQKNEISVAPFLFDGITSSHGMTKIASHVWDRKYGISYPWPSINLAHLSLALYQPCSLILGPLWTLFSSRGFSWVASKGNITIVGYRPRETY